MWRATAIPAVGVSMLPLLCPFLVGRTFRKVDPRSIAHKKFRAEAQLKISNHSGVNSLVEVCNISTRAGQKKKERLNIFTTGLN